MSSSSGESGQDKSYNYDREELEDSSSIPSLELDLSRVREDLAPTAESSRRGTSPQGAKGVVSPVQRKQPRLVVSDSEEEEEVDEGEGEEEEEEEKEEGEEKGAESQTPPAVTSSKKGKVVAVANLTSKNEKKSKVYPYIHKVDNATVDGR